MTKKRRFERIVAKYLPEKTTVEYTATDKGEGVNKETNGEYICYVQPVISEKALAACLHEFGHIIDDTTGSEAWYSTALDRAFGKVTKRVQGEEIRAWKFALKVMKKEKVNINESVRKMIEESLRSYKIPIEEFWKHLEESLC